MIDRKLIELLRSSDGLRRLRIAEKDEIDWINQAILSGGVRDLAEQMVRQPIESGLIDNQEKCIFPIRDGIPSLLVDEAIELLQKGSVCTPAEET